jgi:hypothetical protein
LICTWQEFDSADGRRAGEIYRLATCLAFFSTWRNSGKRNRNHWDHIRQSKESNDSLLSSACPFSFLHFSLIFLQRIFADFSLNFVLMKNGMEFCCLGLFISGVGSCCVAPGRPFSLCGGSHSTEVSNIFFYYTWLHFGKLRFTTERVYFYCIDAFLSKETLRWLK